MKDGGKRERQGERERVKINMKENYAYDDEKFMLYTHTYKKIHIIR